MPVNQPDIAFFSYAAKVVEQQLSTLTAPPTIDDIRKTVKYFRACLSDQPLLSYKELLIPSSYGDHTIRARFVYKDAGNKPLLIFFPGTGFASIVR